MKKIKTLSVLMTLSLFMLSVPVQAQGLGGLINKAKKVANKVDKVLGQNQESQNTGTQSSVKADAAESAATVTLDNGMTMYNSLASSIEIVPVGLYGVSTSENYGKCYIVVKAKMLKPESKTGFGGNYDERMLAVDPDGNTFMAETGIYPFETPEGIMVNISLDKGGLAFKGVKKTVKKMQMVKFGVFIDAYNKGYVKMTDVPIIWDGATEN